MHHISYPYTYEKNGIAKRKHRHIVDLGLAMLSHVSLYLAFLDEAFFSNVFIINRLPSPILHNSSPLEILFCIEPNNNFLKVFRVL